jgi:hypothetical protein
MFMPTATAGPEAAGVEREEIILTVSEGKRLIGLGVAALPVVKRAIQAGAIGIARGSTNGYVAEAILARQIDRVGFTTGVVVPAGRKASEFRDDREVGEIVVERGIVVAGKTIAEAAKSMGPDDVLIKGANALNYQKQVAGILIQNAAGGTIGGIIGAVMGRRITLIIPVGLEKEVGFDIGEANRALERHLRPPRSLWPVTGMIITEIEALHTLTGVQAIQIGAGGVGGAEGSIRLLIQGTTEQMQTASRLLDRIYGEPSFAEAAEEARQIYGGR